MRGFRSAVFIAGVVAVLATQQTATAGPGFGIRKKNIELEVRAPAKVRLTETSLAFTGRATNAEYRPVLDSLLTTLTTEVLSNDKTLEVRPTPKGAAWTLYLIVTGYSAPPPKQETATVGKNNVVRTHWTGNLNVSYQVLDKAGKNHDADNVSEKYDETVEAGASIKNIIVPTAFLPGRAKEKKPASQEDLKQILLHRVAESIAAKLGNTREIVHVRVAGGDDRLERAGVFMEQKLWARALEILQEIPPFPKPKEEAYRQYDLGVVYEALSYDAKNYSEQRANFAEAQTYFDYAVNGDQEEKYFVETIARLKDSVAAYKILDDQLPKTKGNGKATVAAASIKTAAAIPVVQSASAVKGKPGSVAAAALAGVPVTTEPAVKPHTVADIISLYKQNVPLANITEIIQSAPLEFDPVDIPTVLAITEAKLPVSLQNLMRKKVGAAALTSAAPRSAVPPKPATTVKQ